MNSASLRSSLAFRFASGDWMKRILLIALVLFAFAPFVFPQNTTELIEAQTAASSLEIVRNWQLLAVFALIISGILAAIAYGIAIGFEMPELRAWAGTELKQIIANAVLILVIFVAVEFIDVISIAIVNASAPAGLHCDIGESCLQKVSLAYIEDSISAAESGARDTVRNNMKASAWVGRSVGIYGTSIKVGQIGISFPLAAYYMLDVDRYHIVFEYYMGILSSLYSQKFFVEQFAFKVGPVLLAIGIVARSFFFSRKTGGLLIAVAAGVMFFFPAMYLFDWATLDMMIQGDNAVLDAEFGCPSECMKAPPIGYYGDTLLSDTSDVYDVFGDDEESALRVINGESEFEMNATGVAVYSCNYGEGADCPFVCRELPYPSSIPSCADVANQTACAHLDERCKVIRVVEEPTEEADDCPDECKVIPPLKSNCDIGDCIESRLDCRVAKKEEAYDDPPFQWRPSVDDRLEGSERCNEYSKDCPASLDAYESCVWVMPETGSCDSLCEGCPSYCRISGGTEENFAAACFDVETEEFLTACEECPATCKVDISEIEALAPPSPYCSACPAEKRIMGADLPEELTTDDCDYEICPREYRVYPPRSACEECVLTPEQYIYEPPINTECGDMCRPENNMPMKSPGDYRKVDEEGLVGMAEIRSVSRLMIPGYLLPLFNIVATIVFIRTFSGMIGGDIEIPGISKLF